MKPVFLMLSLLLMVGCKDRFEDKSPAQADKKPPTLDEAREAFQQQLLTQTSQTSETVGKLRETTEALAKKIDEIRQWTEPQPTLAGQGYATQADLEAVSQAIMGRLDDLLKPQPAPPPPATTSPVGSKEIHARFYYSKSCVPCHVWLEHLHELPFSVDLYEAPAPFGKPWPLLWYKDTKSPTGWKIFGGTWQQFCDLYALPDEKPTANGDALLPADEQDAIAVQQTPFSTATSVGSYAMVTPLMSRRSKRSQRRQMQVAANDNVGLVGGFLHWLF